MLPHISSRKNLVSLTTLRLPSVAEAYAEASSLDALRALFEEARRRDWKVHLLGGGANTVMRSRVAGLVVRVRLMGLRLTRLPEGGALIRASAGELWDDVVRCSLDAGLGGIENLSGIPGCVGGAVVQNIGAYGVEIAERIDSVEVYDPKDDTVKTLTNEACDFGYRSSVFKKPEGKGLVVLSALIRLPAKASPVTDYKDLAALFEGRESVRPAEISKAVRTIRARKLPSPEDLPNAGSFFKNPVVTRIKADRLLTRYPQLVAYPLPGGRVKLAAGWLIDQAGMRGKTHGGAAVCEKHALILVNQGGAVSEDIEALMAEVQSEVERRFGVLLEPEPVFCG